MQKITNNSMNRNNILLGIYKSSDIHSIYEIIFYVVLFGIKVLLSALQSYSNSCSFHAWLYFAASCS